MTTTLAPSEPKQVWALKYRNEEGCDDVWVRLYATRLDAYLGLLEVALKACPKFLADAKPALTDILASGSKSDERHAEWLEWVELFDHLQYWDVEPLKLPKGVA